MLPIRALLLRQKPTGGGGGGGGPLFWNPADSGAAPNVVLSNSNLTAETYGSFSARGSEGKTSGIWQFEVTIGPDASDAIVGIGNALALTSYGPGTGDFNAIGYLNDGNIINNGNHSAYSFGFAAGGVVTCLVDFTAGEVFFYANGSSVGSVQTLTGVAMPSGALFPMFGDNGAGAPGRECTINTTILYPQSGASDWV